jgi:DNA-binding LacI/PurR family transcriptional regulator
MNIVEFARSLDLSIGTVSRALNNRPDVSPRTRQRVLERAREVGFTADPNARRLKTGKNNLIRFECPHNSHILADPFLVHLARVVEEAVAARGYDLLLRLGASRQGEYAVEFKSVDGLILVASPETTAEDIRHLTDSGRLPTVVICGQELEGLPACACVRLDSLSGVREAIALLQRVGHRRIGYIGSGLAGCRVRSAFPLLLAEAGLEWAARWSIDAGVGRQDGYRAAQRLLQQPEAPTALLARTDLLACGAQQAIHDLGLRVPQDVSLVGHDDIELASLLNPPLTTVGIDILRAGQTASDALFALIDAPTEPTTATIEARLVVRQTCASPRDLAHCLD